MQEKPYRWGPVQELIFLDRYSPKAAREEIQVGDTVVVMTSDDRRYPAKDVGIVEAVEGDEVVVRLKVSGEVIRRPRTRCDKPLETRPEQMWERLARAAVEVEAPERREELQREFRWLLDGFRFVPGGRINLLLGSGQNLTAYNCYVIPVRGRTPDVPADSRHAIIDTLGNMVETMARGGGVGINLSVLRPRLAYVKGVNGKSSGSVSWGALFSFATGLVEQGGCFGPGVRIATDKGLIPARELAYRIDQGEFILAWTHKGFRPITAAFRNGIKPLFRVTTARGLQVEITADHKVGILRGGRLTTVPLRELRVGDEILTLLGIGFNGEYVRLAPVVYDGSKMSTRLNEEVSFPTHLTEELAYLLGYSYGDGYVQVGKKVTWSAPKALKLAVAVEHAEIQSTLVHLIEKLFGVKPTVEPHGKGCVTVALYSRLVIEWLRQNGLLKPKAEKVRVPEAVFRSPTSVMAAFVAGYFDADGSDRGRKAGYGFDSVSEGMLRDLQLILAYNGIPSHVSKVDRSRHGWRDIYRLSVTGAEFKWRLGRFMERAHRTRDIQGHRNHFHSYPTEAWYAMSIPGRYYQGLVDITKGRMSYRALTHIQERLLADSRLEEAERTDELLRTLPDRIVSIEPIGLSDVYDFEVDEVHLLSGNGIYTSNSRRGALMLILNDWHPDIIEFINAKRDFSAITNANISVGISEEFEQALEQDADWELVFPETTDPDYDRLWDGDLKKWKAMGKPVKVYQRLRARDLFRQIVESAWASAEPGFVRLDYANKMSNSWYYAPLIATNPCGEQGLPAWGVCLLGHLNLARFVEDGEVKWDELGKAARLGVRFLDNVIDITPYFFKENERLQKMERRVGMGTMGLAEMLIHLGIRYGSPEAVKFVDRLYAFISREAYLGSVELAKEKGPFPAFDAEKYLQSGFMQTMPEDVREAVRKYGIRNVTLLTQAPTGTTGTMAATSTGIEPYYAWSYWRQGRLGRKEIFEPVIQEYLEAHPELGGDLKKLPPYFVTALELTPEEHVRMQAAIQRWVDSALSKTANLPSHYTVEQTLELYQLAMKLGCKGVTIYRDKSRDEQVLIAKDEGTPGSEQTAAAPAQVAGARREAAPGPAGSPLDVEPKAVIGEVPEEVEGFTYRQKTMVGTARVVVNEYPKGQPFETIIVLGKGGMDITADAEAIGRLISLYLRTPSPISNLEKLALVVEQLRNIGGAQPFGYGPNKVLSMPDALAKALERYLHTRRGEAGVEQRSDRPQPLTSPAAPGPTGAARPEGEGPEGQQSRYAGRSAAGSAGGTNPQQLPGQTRGLRPEARSPATGAEGVDAPRQLEQAEGGVAVRASRTWEAREPGVEAPATTLTHPGEAVTQPNGHHRSLTGADICPMCGQAQYVRIEGCGYCQNCGYTRC